MRSPISTGEAARLAALHKYEILDTPPEAAFDRIVALAARLLSAPMACLTLIDERRLWLKAAYGLELRETPRAGSLCDGTIRADGVVVIPNAAEDSRFRAHPLVESPPGVRFYAGAPLIDPEGFSIGTLAVLDPAPRPGLAPGQEETLRALAEAAMDELELRRAAAAGRLHLSHVTLASMLDALPVGVWVADRKGNVVYNNPAARAIWAGGRYVSMERYDEYQAWSADTGERISAEDWALARALRSGEAALGDVRRILTFDGKTKFILNSAVPLRGPAGEIVGAIAVDQDVTDQRHVEESLRRTRDQLESLIDASPIAIVTLNLDGDRVQSWNPAAESMFGWRAEEVIGRPLPLVPERLRPELDKNRDSVQRGRAFQDLETTRRRKDGSLVEVSVSGAPLHRPSGEICGGMIMYVDRTERAAAERALRESEERYRALVEHSPDAIVVHAGGRILYANPAAARLFGVANAAESIGQPVDPFVPPEALEAFRERTRSVLETGEPAPLIEVRLRKFDGSVVDVESMALLLRSGGQDAVLLVMRDVSDRKRAELRARAHERNLAVLADSLPAFVVIKDRDARYVMANRKFCETVRCSADEIPGKSDFDFFDEETARRQRAGDFAVMSSGQPRYLEAIAPFRHGPRVESGVVLAPLISEGGEANGLLTIAFDLTEKKAMQAEIRRTEDWFQRAIDTALIPMMIHSEDGRIIRVNDALTELSGYESADLASVDEWITKACVDDSPELRERIRGLYALGPTSDAFEVRIRTKAGKIRIWISSHTPLGSMPEGSRVVITMAMDVTEQHSLEQQLAQSQKMEAVGQLAGGVAHDFNNLLTVIGGYSSLLLQSLPEYDPARPHVQEISDAASRAASLTRQLLAFSRKQMLQPANVDVNSLVRDSESMLRRLIGEDIAVQLGLEETELRAVVDAGQFTQVIMNLAVNARDAMPGGGVLTIETRAAEIGEEYAAVHPEVQAGSFVEVAISDTGSGIDPAVLPRIFEPFFTTKGPGEGTGLGLSTVYGIVRQSNGHIAVYSELGRGTTFRVYLPRIFEAPAPVEVKPAAAPRRGTETVLLVEDEPELRKLTRTILASAGYKVLEAANGGAALLACEQATPEIALMLTDVVMPGMSGPDLAARLAPLRPKMRVLYMSGYTDRAAIASKALGSGLDYIQKPFTPSALVARVRAILDRD
jgi:two-component system cell cycle sensor histidine kinase/response regulator CckA